MKKYKYSFFMGFQKAIEYRMDFIFGLISSIFPIIIQISLWAAIYKTTNEGIMYGYTYKQMIMYTFMVGIISKFLATGFEYEINDDIKNGGLNKYIVKPINYYMYRISCFLGERASASVLFSIILFVLLTLFYIVGYFNISIISIVLFVMSIIFALLLNFSIYYCIGMSGFWMSEISRLFPAITIIFTVISGGIFPLDILGEKINNIISMLPFKYMLQFPVDIITGKMNVDNILYGLIFQFLWISFFMILSSMLWKRGLKKYVSIGG